MSDKESAVKLDMVEVVRYSVKDHKYQEGIGNVCMKQFRLIDLDDFCSDGVRDEDIVFEGYKGPWFRCAVRTN